MTATGANDGDRLRTIEGPEGPGLYTRRTATNPAVVDGYLVVGTDIGVLYTVAGRFGRGKCRVLGGTSAVAAADVDHHGVVKEAVDDGAGDELVGEDLAPVGDAEVIIEELEAAAGA
jgi:hypothetical protein